MIIEIGNPTKKEEERKEAQFNSIKQPSSWYFFRLTQSRDRSFNPLFYSFINNA